LSPSLSKVYRHQEAHDPGDVHRAREIASLTEQIPVGILYRNTEAPCYEDVRMVDRMHTPDVVRRPPEKEFDKFTIWPDED
jgi:2-oxoglutarate ferredoxin oxidoreductase subunit beta